MRYCKITWIHNFEDEPVLYFHEIDDSNYETRKVVLYRNGKVEIASNSFETDECFLSSLPIPQISEINQEAQFIAIDISLDDFEKIWLESVSKRQERGK